MLNFYSGTIMYFAGLAVYCVGVFDGSDGDARTMAPGVLITVSALMLMKENRR